MSSFVDLTPDCLAVIFYMCKQDILSLRLVCKKFYMVTKTNTNLKYCVWYAKRHHHPKTGRVKYMLVFGSRSRCCLHSSGNFCFPAFIQGSMVMCLPCRISKGQVCFFESTSQLQAVCSCVFYPLVFLIGVSLFTFASFKETWNFGKQLYHRQRGCVYSCCEVEVLIRDPSKQGRNPDSIRYVSVKPYHIPTVWCTHALLVNETDPEIDIRDYCNEEEIQPKRIVMIDDDTQPLTTSWHDRLGVRGYDEL